MTWMARRYSATFSSLTYHGQGLSTLRDDSSQDREHSDADPGTWRRLASFVFVKLTCRRRRINEADVSPGLGAPREMVA